jgi:very-short-patch-repair endonuclease
MSVRTDSAVAKVAARQKTLATTAQLAECGLDKDAVAYRVHSRRLCAVFRGVYTVSPGELPPLALELAALLACGEHTLVSHHSAAFVWGLRTTPPPRVEVSVVGRFCDSRKGIRVHRIQSIHRSELKRHEGLWISSPARAILEVAATASVDEVAHLVNEGHGLRLFTPRHLEAVLRRHRGRRGAARLAQVLGNEDAMTITRSRAEKAFLKLIRDARLPAPETNQRLGRYFPDFMWREQRLIVELDSYRFHAGPAGFQNDHEKDFVYRDAGFDVLRPTRNHVIHEPARVLVSVVRALERSRSA